MNDSGQGDPQYRSPEPLATMQQSSDWNCTGQTGWTSPTSVSPSSSKIAAQLRVSVADAVS